MSRQYDNYLVEHKNNVYRGYLWILTNIGEEDLDDILPEIRYPEMMVQMKCHDASKSCPDEYDAYDRYFYGDGKGNHETRKEFNKAFLIHIHRNPHHWQYWVLVHDDGAEGDTRKMDPVDMPDNYILEMICDWWSFSWKKYDETEDIETLQEIFDWYDEHQDGIVMSSETKRKVEKVLDILKDKIEEYEDVEEIDSEGEEDERDIDDPDGGVVIVGGKEEE